MVIGFVLIALAVAAATVLIVQNTGRVPVHALGHTWTVSASWLVVAALALFLIAIVGASLVRRSGQRRLRRQKAMLVAQNREMADQLGAATNGEVLDSRPRTGADPTARHRFRRRPAT